MVSYKALITELYSQYRLIEDNFDYASFEKKIGLDYDNIDKKNFIKELLGQNYVYNFVDTVFFSFPKLWSDFNIEDWTDIVNNTIRPEVRPYVDNHGCFYDLSFLNKYLNINLFALLEDNEQNKALIAKMLAFTEIFIINEVELEYFEDGTITITDILEETSKRLQIKKELISENRTYHAFEDYLKNWF